MSRRSSTRPSTACNYKTTAWSGYLPTLHSLYHGLFLLGKSTGEHRMWVWMTSTSDSGREISVYVSWTDTRRPQSHDNRASGSVFSYKLRYIVGFCMIVRDGHLDRSEAYDISQRIPEYEHGPSVGWDNHQTEFSRRWDKIETAVGHCLIIYGKIAAIKVKP